MKKDVEKASIGDEPKMRGRPRAFDRDKALRSALELFWTRGYEATSISDLKEGMGITAPSLYAAFGNKDALFLECVELYSRDYLGEIFTSLFQPGTAKAAIERVMLRFGALYAGAGHPKGCLIVSGAANCGPEAAMIEADLKRRRIEGVALLRDRIQKGVQAGEFKSRVDAGEWAEFYAAVLLGLAMRARDGASRKEMETTARISLLAWPR
jgi:TetR/AcrR family transcriptional regulator, copper-responsive repressor